MRWSGSATSCRKIVDSGMQNVEVVLRGGSSADFGSRESTDHRRARTVEVNLFYTSYTVPREVWTEHVLLWSVLYRVRVCGAAGSSFYRCPVGWSVETQYVRLNGRICGLHLHLAQADFVEAGNRGAVVLQP